MRECNFIIYVILLPTLGPGVYSASKKYEYQKKVLGSRARPVRRVENLAICEPTVWRMWDP
jgi:hypothetical protein